MGQYVFGLSLGLPKDSPFRDPDQIPLPEPSHIPPIQDLAQNEEEDSLSMRKLVEEIDFHTKVIDLEIPSNLGIAEGQEPPPPLLHPNPPTTAEATPNPSEQTQDPED